MGSSFTLTVRCADRIADEGATGEIVAFALYGGRSVGLVRNIQPVAAVIAQISLAFQ